MVREDFCSSDSFQEVIRFKRHFEEGNHGGKQGDFFVWLLALSKMIHSMRATTRRRRVLLTAVCVFFTHPQRTSSSIPAMIPTTARFFE
jgi:hypothetical protein